MDTVSDKLNTGKRQADTPVVLPEVVIPPDLPKLIPAVPSTVIFLGDRNPEISDTLDKGRRTCDGIQPTTELIEVIDLMVVKWFEAVHNSVAGHNGIDETVRRLFELPQVRTMALRGKLPRRLLRWIERLVKHCPTCVKYSFRKPTNVAAHFSCSSYVKMN